MRRLHVVIAVLIGILVLAFASVPGARPTRDAQVERTTQVRTLDRARGEVPWVLEEAPPHEFDARVQRVNHDCGLAVSSSCGPSGCAAVLRAPDLDSVGGWGEMAWRHPWFVGNIVGRELGMGQTPCATALASTFPAGVLALEPDGADEIWCAASPAGPEVSVGPLCDRAARRIVGLAEGPTLDFGRATRTLSF